MSDKTQWQPIETATDPVRGRHVLLYGDGPGFEACVIVGYWSDGGEWVTLDGVPGVKATHWMPLPETPQ